MALEFLRVVGDAVNRHVGSERERLAVQREFLRLTNGWAGDGDVVDAKVGGVPAAERVQTTPDRATDAET